MKNLLKWLPCLLFAICILVSCGIDEEDKVFYNDNRQETELGITILIGRYQGNYVGKAYSNDVLTGDNEIVSLKVMQDSLLHLQADFLEYKYWKNFRVDSINNRHYLRNEALEGFSIYIETDSLFIDYTNNSQEAISYRGKKTNKDN